MRFHAREIATFLPVAVSAAMGVINTHFRSTHPLTPNYESAIVGAALGAISFLIGIHIIFFERRRPERYSKAWHRFAIAIVLWLGGVGVMAVNMATARPE